MISPCRARFSRNLPYESVNPFHAPPVRSAASRPPRSSVRPFVRVGVSVAPTRRAAFKRKGSSRAKPNFVRVRAMTDFGCPVLLFYVYIGVFLFKYTRVMIFLVCDSSVPCVCGSYDMKSIRFSFFDVRGPMKTRHLTSLFLSFSSSSVSVCVSSNWMELDGREVDECGPRK